MGCAIRSYTASFATAVLELQKRYAQAWPGAAVIASDVYAHPAFDDGRNIPCAFDGKGRLVGYAPLFPVRVTGEASDDAHTLWMVVKVAPGLDDPRPIQDLLFDAVMARARAIKVDPPRAARDSPPNARPKSRTRSTT